MKKSLIFCLLVAMGCIYCGARLQAQHFIAVQAADKLAFTVRVNGGNVTAAKNGLVKVPNLIAGSYKLLVAFAPNTIAAQSFTCAVGKEDASYILKNLGTAGWVLRNVGNGQVVQASTDLWDSEEPEGRAAPTSNGFALMLAQVADDSDLLKPTVWVYSDKIEGQGVADVGQLPQPGDFGTTYGGPTRGVLKLMDEETNGAKNMVFYDFNGDDGDTVRVTYATTDMAGDAAVDSSLTVATKPSENVGGTPTVGHQTTLKDTGMAEAIASIKPNPTGEDSLLTGRGPKAADTALVSSSSAAGPVNNPFFNKKGVVVVQAADTSLHAVVAKINPPTVDTTILSGLGAGNPPAVANLPQNANTTVPALLATKTGCQNMLNASGLEKLKRKIYLEQDEAEMANIAKNYLDGKCITTEQVKALASYFSTDDARLFFFKAVYPMVYDYGNFGTLEKYMIDNNYKEAFRAMLK